MTNSVFRIIDERSGLRNNDEWVHYSPKDYSDREAIEALRRQFWDEPTNALGVKKRLVICRPVAPEEISEGLNTSFKGRTTDEETPKLTDLLDSLFRLAEHFHAVRTYWRPEAITPAKVLSEYLAANYYDCMSTGCPISDLAIIRKLCDLPNVDLSEKVYPSSETLESGDEDTWHDLRSFISEMDKKDFVAEFDELWEKYKSVFQKALPVSDWKLLGA